MLDGGVVERGDHAFVERPVTVRRHGDLVEMLRVPQIERALEPESLACLQVVRSDTGTPYRDSPESEVLILGDSFLRIYEQDEPGAAGFIAHLARELGRPLTSIVNDGGAPRWSGKSWHAARAPEEQEAGDLGIRRARDPLRDRGVADRSPCPVEDDPEVTDSIRPPCGLGRTLQCHATWLR